MPKGVPVAHGTSKVHRGRVMIKVVNHLAFGTRFVPRTHLVWWRYKKQIVPSGWCLHHKDEAKQHDIMSNLQLMTKSAHRRYHRLYGLRVKQDNAKITEAAKRVAASEAGYAQLKRMTIAAHASVTAVAAMKKALWDESHSKKGRERRSKLCKQLWRDGKLSATAARTAKAVATKAATKKRRQEDSIDEYFFQKCDPPKKVA